jgi:hypothetical protein
MRRSGSGVGERIRAAGQDKLIGSAIGVGCGSQTSADSVVHMPNTPPLVSSAVAASGLVGGFLVARSTGRRELGGLLFAAAGAWCARDWYRASGPAAAAGLSALYAAAMGGSHPLAKRIGAWPSVAAVTAVTVAASELVIRTSAR